MNDILDAPPELEGDDQAASEGAALSDEQLAELDAELAEEPESEGLAEEPSGE